MGPIKYSTIKVLEDNKKLLYHLSQIPLLGAVSISNICQVMNPLNELLYIEETQLQHICKLSSVQLKAVFEFIRDYKTHQSEYDAQYYGLEDKNIRWITIYDKEYPQRLRNIHAAPVGLFIKGGLPSDDIASVAIVGSRGATNYGLSMARFIASELSKEGIQIVSGLAAGIDVSSHIGALDSGGNTYGVLACGVNICYPKENYYAYSKMCNEGGVISETPPDIQALKKYFPMRNRIISGLADVVVVIEAREKSGSLITVDHALDQNRDVFALPGRLTDPLSRGCNLLIKNGAQILTGPEDIIEALGIKINKTLNIREKNLNLLAKNQKRVYACLDLQPKFVDEIVTEIDLDISEVINILLELELLGYITQLSGNYYGIKVD